MTDHSKKLVKLFIRILITASLLWLVLSRIDLEQLGRNIKTARWGFLVIIWALTVTAFWIRAIKMRLVLKKQDCEVDTTKIFGASAVTSLYGLIMPGMLSTGAKWYILKQHTGKGSNVLSSMVYNQVTDIVVKLLLGLVAVIITNPGKGAQLPVICSIIATVIVAGCFLLLNRRTGAKVSAALSYALRAFPKIVRSPAETILEQVKVFQTTGYRFHLLIAGVSLTASLLGVVIYICAARAAGINVPAIALVWQSSAVYILGRLPISVANLGVREFT
jgi:uncharacterized membrane protein YbhN (UPF0104 family)